MTSVRWLVKALALRYGILSGLYRRWCRPNGEEYAEFLRRHGRLRSIGQDCSILTETEISDPAYVRLGNNVSYHAAA